MMYCCLVLLPAFGLAACQDMSQYSQAYREVHEREFWRNYTQGGPDGMGVANLLAHTAAEKATGEKAK